MSLDELMYQQSPIKIDYSVKNLVRMNLNENLVLPESFLRSVMVRCLDRLESRYYPSELGEGEMQALLVEISKYCSCSTEMISLGNGSDQLIDLLLRMRLKKSSDTMLTVEPTFPMYAMLARRIGAKVAKVSVNPFRGREPFSLRLEELLKAAKTKDVKIIALASPNNPTGVQYPTEQVREILESLPNTTILLDEAYVEYGNYSAVKLLLNSHSNLVVMRTFSKAFALASHRLGYIVCSDTEFVKQFIQEFQYPYPIATFGVLIATELLKRKTAVLESVRKTKIFGAELVESLVKLKSPKIHPTMNSSANFIISQSNGSERITKELLSKYKIALKYIKKIGKESGFLRITVGTRELDEKLLYSLRRINTTEE